MTKTRWKEPDKEFLERHCMRQAKTRRETVEEVLGLFELRHDMALLQTAILDHFGLELVPPEQQYRMLREGEVIKKGDEYHSMDRGWRPTYREPGEVVQRSQRNEYRRPLPEAPECEWCGQVLPGFMVDGKMARCPDLHECPPVELKAGDVVESPKHEGRGVAFQAETGAIHVRWTAHPMPCSGGKGCRRHNPGDPPEGRRCK